MHLSYTQVKRVIPNGVAARDGRIKKGDCVLSVNSHSLTGLTKKEAAQLLKKATGHVILVIRRLEEPDEAGSSKNIPPPSTPERKTCSEQHTVGVREKEGAEKVEKSTYSAIFSWMGKKGIQQVAEKISKLVGETTASLTFGSKRKSSTQSNDESVADDTPGILRLEDECDVSTENSEPDFTSPGDPRVKPEPSELEEHDHSSSMTSYTEVYTEAGEDSRRSSLQHWQGESMSSLSSYQGSKAVMKEYRRKYPDSQKLTDLQHRTRKNDSIGQEVPASLMPAQRRKMSADNLSRALGPHEHFMMMTQEAALPPDLSPSSSDASGCSHLKHDEGVLAMSVYKTGEEEGLSSDNQSTHTHSSSEQDSMPASTVYGHAEKLHLPLPWSPQHYHPQECSEDMVLGQNRVNTPAYSKKHPRNSVNPQGEILTFRDQKSTLPRRIAGNKDNLHLVELRKGAGWLGIQLQGGVDPDHMTQPMPIMVQTIVRGGAAYRSGRIHEGDEIIEVNGLSLANLTLREAVDTVRQQPQGNIFFILRENNHYGYGYTCRKKLF